MDKKSARFQYYTKYAQSNTYIPSLMWWQSADTTCKYQVIFWSVEYIFVAHGGVFYVYR